MLHTRPALHPPEQAMRSHPATRASAPRANRRQRVPPALTRAAGRVDAILILDEIPGDLGLLLWRSARNVLLWAETPSERRHSLFPDTAARGRGEDLAQITVPAEVRGPMSVLAELLARPSEVDLTRLVNACKRLSGWAEQRGSLATAVEFAQAAALAAPDSASLAYAVGRLARRLAEYDRAESWYTRAAVQGRHTGDWHSYAMAVSGMANLYMQKGNYPAARRFARRCLRAADLHGLFDLVGSAYHDLFVIATDAGELGQTDRLARLALRAYGPRDPRVPRLGYDVAYHWATQGYFARALALGRALLPRMQEPSPRAMVLGLLARSAAGVGDLAEFRNFAHEARFVAEQESAREMAARALLGVVHGAAHLEQWDLARDVGARALAIARKQNEGRVIFAVEAALASVDAERGRAEAPLPASTTADALAIDFVRVLAGKEAAAV